MSNNHEVYQLVTKIPKGKVLSYGHIAKLVGIKKPRFVGKILNLNPNHQKAPCHRVVNSKGKLSVAYAFGGLEAQRKKLEGEDLQVVNNKVKIKDYL